MRALGALKPEVPAAAMEELAVAAFVELEAAETGMEGIVDNKLWGMSSSSLSGT